MGGGEGFKMAAVLKGNQGQTPSDPEKPNLTHPPTLLFRNLGFENLLM